MTWLSFWSADTVVVKDWHGWRTLSWPDRRELSSGTGALHPRPGSEDFAVVADGRLTVNGEPVRVDGRVAEVAWTPDRSLLVVTGRPNAPHRAPPSLLPVPAQGCTAQRFGSYPDEGMQLWRVPLSGGGPESLWRATGIQKIGKPTALPDGRVAFSLWDPPLYGAPASFRLRVLDGPGSAVDPFPDLPGALHWTTTSPRGDAFSFWHSPLDPPFPPWYRLCIAGPDGLSHPFPEDLQLVPDAVWAPDGAAVGALALDGVHAHIVTAGGSVLGPTDGYVSSFAVAPGGTEAIATWETLDREPGLWVFDGTGEGQPFTVDGPARSAPPPAMRLEVVRWSRDGVSCAGLLARPADADGRLPLVVVIPAGPASLPVCRRELATWCRAGFAAFAAGYRSSGTGGREPMLAALRGTDATPGRSDALDVLAGLDEVLASGIADPDRLYLFGHAHGAYLVNRIATMDDRFRAGVAWDGYADAALCYCLDGGGGGNQITRRLYDGSPWDRPKRYREMSPVEEVGRVRTPLLLLHGDAAPAEPVVWFTALREHGVKAELYFYRGEGEGMYRHENLVDVYRRSAAWFQDHSGPTGRGRR